jgi:topoisomerase-4 subunit A
LARLEGIKIEQELEKLRAEKEGLLKLLGSDPLLRRLVIREIKADAAKHGDARRTLIWRRRWLRARKSLPSPTSR